MWVMERKNNYGIACFISIGDPLYGFDGEYGERTTNLNAATAMFLMATDKERERWIELLDRARRMKDDRTIFERLKLLTSPAAVQVVEHLVEEHPEIDESTEEVEREIGGVKPRKPATPKNIVPGPRRHGKVG